MEIHNAKGELVDTVSVFDAGHRIADAVVRFSNLRDDIRAAFAAARSVPPCLTSEELFGT